MSKYLSKQIILIKNTDEIKALNGQGILLLMGVENVIPAYLRVDCRDPYSPDRDKVSVSVAYDFPLGNDDEGWEPVTFGSTKPPKIAEFGHIEKFLTMDGLNSIRPRNSSELGLERLELDLRNEQEH